VRNSTDVIASDTLGMKTNNILISVFVVKTRERSQHANTFPEVGGRERRAEMVPVTDLLMQTPLSYEG
jgi:hypothetical protein